MKRWLLFLAIFALFPSTAQAVTQAPPIRATFYYPWFDETTFGNYTPLLGKYDYDSVQRTQIIDQHIDWFAHAKIEAGIASWWSPGRHNEDERIPALLSRSSAKRSPVGWALYYECEQSDVTSSCVGRGPNPSVETLRQDLGYILSKYAWHPSYLRYGTSGTGKPVIFVYSSGDDACEVAGRWKEANRYAGFYVSLKLSSGFRDCPIQPDNWHQYGPSTAYHEHAPYYTNVSPRFCKGSEAPTCRLADDPVRFAADVRRQVATTHPWQLVTSFNEWGEGTGVEPAQEYMGQFTPPTEYLDILRADGQ